MKNQTITAVPGVLVGQVEDPEALTGCTVILTPQGAVCGVDIRGSAPGTRETDLLNPVHTMQAVHGLVLSGGSAFGLDAASGVMAFLEEQGVGFDVGIAKVPIVPAAVLFDLAVGNSNIRPTKEMGYAASEKASTEPVRQGNYGAGCGATVGKLAGPTCIMKGGVGSALIKLPNHVVVGAIVAVNAVGEIRHFNTQEILAGALDSETKMIINSEELLKTTETIEALKGSNTTIGVIATNACLTKAEATKIAQLTHNALVRTTFPAHTTMDGDTMFALSTGNQVLPVDVVGQAAIEAMERAIIQAIQQATSTHGIVAAKDL